MSGSVQYRDAAFIPTTREVPGDTQQLSHRYMLRAGLVRQLGSGSYSKLPMGFDVCRRLEDLIDEEMLSRGASRVHFPALQPVSIWRDAGRFETYGDDIFSFLDRHGKETCMAPTHEIAAALLGASDIRSYKNMPCRLYQTQIKFRDEVRPRGGVLRTREFTMHDLYSFDVDDGAAQVSYELFHDAYLSVFRRIDLPIFPVETSDTGAIGGSVSHEFIYPSVAGESEVWVTADRSSAVFELTSAGSAEGMTQETGLELAHTFQLGTQYSDRLGAEFVTAQGGKMPIWMCSFGLGVERTVAAVVEHNLSGDAKMVWPKEISPYPINIMVSSSELQSGATTAAKVATRLAAAGYRVMIDDRDIGMGVKFADSGLLGPRWELVLGREAPRLELRDQATGTVTTVEPEAAVATIERMEAGS